MTPSVRAGWVKPYAGNLPFDINRDDSEEELARKFPGGMMAVKDYRFDLDLRPLIVTLHVGTLDFQSPGVGKRKLKMVSVKYEDPMRPVCYQHTSISKASYLSIRASFSTFFR